MSQSNIKVKWYKFLSTTYLILFLSLSCKKESSLPNSLPIKIDTSIYEHLNKPFEYLIVATDNNSSKCVSNNPYDIDGLYPFNKIKKCIIMNNTNEIIYEDSENFDDLKKSHNVMVELPKVYFKREIKNEIEYLSMSEKLREGFWIDPAFIEDGQVIDKIYISAYQGSLLRNKLMSISGEKPDASYSLKKYRELAANNGLGYSLLDARSLFFLQRLFIIYYADRNSQEVLGEGITRLFWQTQSGTIAIHNAENSNYIHLNLSGYTDRHFKVNQYCAIAPHGEYSLNQKRVITKIEKDINDLTKIHFDGPSVNIRAGITRLYGQIQKAGLTDTIIEKNGVSNYFNSDKNEGVEAIKFLHIENLWGNVWSLIDGLFIKDLYPYIGENIKDYGSIDKELLFKKLNYQVPLQNLNKQNKEEEEYAYVSKLGLDKNFPGYTLPSKIGLNASPTTGYCDPFYSYDTNGEHFYAAHGGGHDHHKRAGLFTLRIWWREDQGNKNLHGARIQYKPLN